ncbi:MAG: AAA family ATPase [Bacilli bacterium]|nr:AAA family ATPase [Bacilli bacterium]
MKSNKNTIKDSLSGTNKRTFQTQVLNDNLIKIEFFKKIFDTLDNALYDTFIKKMLKASFKKSKALGDAIVNNEDFSKSEMVAFLAKLEENDRNNVIELCGYLDLDLKFDQEEFERQKDNLALEEMRNSRDEKAKENEKLKQELEDQRKEFQQNLDKARDEARQAREAKAEQEALNKELEEKIHKLESAPRPEPRESGPLSEKRIENREQLIEESEDITVDLNRALNDLEGRTLIGVVKADGILPERGYILITPIVPIMNENVNFSRQEFIKNVDYRGDYSTFMLFLNKNLLDQILPIEDAESYSYMSNDERYSCLSEAFNKKLVFFTPYFYEGGDKLKLNATLIGKPIEYGDYNSSLFVPSFGGSKKDFESIVRKGQDLILPNYPCSLAATLRYVWVKDSLYEINYVPNFEDADNFYNRWKIVEQQGKEPYRKLDIKVIEEKSEQYIIAPSVYEDEPSNLYVKNITFLKASMRKNTVFDEQDFIYKVVENAKSRNLYYDEKDIRNFHAALKSSNLVILEGPSGIGKTRLPMVYADTLGLDRARKTVLFVPVSPSYLEPEDVLGYIRPMNGRDDNYNAEFMESQTGLVSFLIDAAEHKDKIHLVIFDEMNLSQIEHWFAPFISLLEQDPDNRVLNLYSDNLNVRNGDRYPSSINIGENLFFIGTVNIDETTKQISDRLMDRAIVINLSAPSFTSLKDMGTAESENFPEISYSRFATSLSKVGNSATEFKDEEFALLNELNELLTGSVYNKGISFRSLNKMAIYLKNSANILEREEAFDFVISQIVVKKISGSKEELDDILVDDETMGILSILNKYPGVSSFKKTQRLVRQKIQEVNKYGFTR